jgi:hypothetical protein
MINNGTYISTALPTAGGQGSNTITLNQITGGVYTPPSVFNQLNAFAIPPPPVTIINGSYLFPDSDTNFGYLSVPFDPDFCFDTGDFTIEWFQYLQTNTLDRVTIFSNGNRANGGTVIRLDIEHNDANSMRLVLIVIQEPLFVGIVQNTDLFNTWVHFAVVSNGGYINIYKNGSPLNANVAQINNITPTYGSLYIGSNTGPSQLQGFAGNLSNFRIVKGVAVYKSNFTKPTTQLIPIPGTVLLLVNNAIIDSSGTNKIVTNVNVTYSNMSPF